MYTHCTRRLLASRLNFKHTSLTAQKSSIFLRKANFEGQFTGQLHSLSAEKTVRKLNLSLRGIFADLPLFKSATKSSTKVSMGDKGWSPATVAVVTGGNKGIGFFIARRLAVQGLTTILTARQPGLGEEAVRKLKGEGLSNVVFHQLDITDQTSIRTFSRWIEEKYGGLDILVNNAGFAHKGNVFGAEEAKFVLGVNYEGTKNVTEALVPLLRKSAAGARVVCVCSMAGKLRIVSKELQAELSRPDLSQEQLAAIVGQFPEKVATNTHCEAGWPSSMYGVSKLAESTYTRILAREVAGRPEGEKVFVNACCPGWCSTDMSSWGGRKTADQGAETPVLLALHPPKSGGFFSEEVEESF